MTAVMLFVIVRIALKIVVHNIEINALKYENENLRKLMHELLIRMAKKGW